MESAPEGVEEGGQVEIDSSSYFLTWREVTGTTLMKWWYLDLMVYTVVRLPFWVSCRSRLIGMVTLLLLMSRLLCGCICGKFLLRSSD